MSDFQHTTGPWFLDPSDETVVVIDRRPLKQKFSVLGHSEVADAEDYANALLIANAPALLEMVERLTNSFPSDSDMHAAGWDQYEIDEACDAFEAARALIKKATGT